MEEKMSAFYIKRRLGGTQHLKCVIDDIARFSSVGPASHTPTPNLGLPPFAAGYIVGKLERQCLGLTDFTVGLKYCFRLLLSFIFPPHCSLLFLEKEGLSRWGLN